MVSFRSQTNFALTSLKWIRSYIILAFAYNSGICSAQQRMELCLAPELSKLLLMLVISSLGKLEKVIMNLPFPSSNPTRWSTSSPLNHEDHRQILWNHLYSCSVQHLPFSPIHICQKTLHAWLYGPQLLCEPFKSDSQGFFLVCKYCHKDCTLEFDHLYEWHFCVCLVSICS